MTYRAKRRLAAGIAALAGLLLVPLPGLAAPQPAAVHPRVLVVTTFQYGDPSDERAVGEAQRWVTRDRLTRRIAIAGLAAPLYCDAAGAECLIVTGEGKVNATASVLVAGVSPQLDLRGTYTVLAGIAGTSPEVASLGSVAVAGWIVDGDLTYEIDPREPLTHERFARSRLGWKTGTEVFRLDAALRAWALARVRGVTLLDSPRARRYRTHYAATPAGGRVPGVYACDVLGSDTYWQGAIASAFATWWTAQSTGGRATYCMSSMEDAGVALALERLTAMGRADAARLIVVRAASDYDRPYGGQSPRQSLQSFAASGGATLAFDNLYVAGEPIVRALRARAGGVR
jgi:purine nucleoside permease